MPLLCVFPKPGGSGLPAFRSSDLIGSLCPYRGELKERRFGSAVVYATELVALADDAAAPGPLCKVPARGVPTAHGAWLSVRRDPDGTLCFETDPLGMFPLWVVETADLIAITSEAKSLRACPELEPVLRRDLTTLPARRTADFSPYENVRRVWPGAVLRVSTELALHEERRAPLVYEPRERFASFEESSAALGAALADSAAAIAISGHNLATFLSGGIDSSFATALLARRTKSLQTFTLGSELGDEYADAAALAHHLGVVHRRVFVREDEVRPHFERAIFCNETVDGLTAETVAQLSVLAEAAARAGVTQVVTGYGADLLFGSMLRHTLYMQATGVDDLRSLVERTAWTGEFCPFFAWSLGVEVQHLFWHPALMNVAFRIPEEHNFDGGHEKRALRAAAVNGRHLLEEHAYRRKQALTDGTQFNQLLSRCLGLAGAHDYRQKNDITIGHLADVVPSRPTGQA